MNNVHVEEINCQEAVKRIAGYLDKQLSAKKYAELERHIEACRHCFDRVEFERLLKSRLASLRVGVNSEHLRLKVEELLQVY